MIYVQTGAGIDIVIDDQRIGLYPHGQEIIWLRDPVALIEVLTIEVTRLRKEQHDAKANQKVPNTAGVNRRGNHSG